MTCKWKYTLYNILQMQMVVQAAVFRRKASEVQGLGHLPEQPLSSMPFGRLVADIDSSGEPQVSLHASGCPTRLSAQSPPST